MEDPAELSTETGDLEKRNGQSLFDLQTSDWFYDWSRWFLFWFFYYPLRIVVLGEYTVNIVLSLVSILGIEDTL